MCVCVGGGGGDWGGGFLVALTNGSTGDPRNVHAQEMRGSRYESNVT